MYLGELCKVGKPCNVRRKHWDPEVSWTWAGVCLLDGNSIIQIRGDNGTLCDDWELATSKVIDWPEGTWGYNAEGIHPVYRANDDYGIVFLTHGPYVLKLNNYPGTIDPKAKEEVMLCQ